METKTTAVTRMLIKGFLERSIGDLLAKFGVVPLAF